MSLGELPELEETQSGKELICIGEPHIHALVTRGAFTPEGEFLEVPEFDLERLQAAWQEAVFAPTQSTGCPADGGQDRAGSGREHAQLAAQRVQR